MLAVPRGGLVPRARQRRAMGCGFVLLSGDRAAIEIPRWSRFLPDFAFRRLARAG